MVIGLWEVHALGAARLLANPGQGISITHRLTISRQSLGLSIGRGE